ncbi:MAG: ECF-type sigma factor [Planctomycetaceae bacterium]
MQAAVPTLTGDDSMHVDESITLWIDQLRAGDSSAAQKLWETYFQRMVNLARGRLDGASKQMADEEDVAVSAFRSFCIGAQEGRFTQLTDRTNLWPLLIAITANKAVDLIRYNNRAKRGGAQALESTVIERARPISPDEVFTNEPTPEFAAQVAEDLQRLLKRLDDARDPQLQQIALWKMDGESNTDIAVKLGCARRTVERKLRMIASLWSRDEPA